MLLLEHSVAFYPFLTVYPPKSVARTSQGPSSSLPLPKLACTLRIHLLSAFPPKLVACIAQDPSSFRLPPQISGPHRSGSIFISVSLQISGPHRSGSSIFISAISLHRELRTILETKQNTQKNQKPQRDPTSPWEAFCWHSCEKRKQASSPENCSHVCSSCGRWA